MKEYKATLTIDVFLDAETLEDAQEKLHRLDYNFQDSISNVSYDSDLTDAGLEEVDFLLD